MNQKQKELVNKLNNILNILDFEIVDFNIEFNHLKKLKALYLELKLMHPKNNFSPICIKNNSNDSENIVNIMNLIDLFYKNRKTEMQNRILIDSIPVTTDIGCDYMIKTLSSDIWAFKKEDINEKNKAYELFYQELEDFASFIKQEISNKG